MSESSLFLQADAARAAMAAAGHTTYADPLARAGADAYAEQHTKADQFAQSEITAIARQRDVVVIGPGTPYERVRIAEVRELHNDYRRDSSNDRPLDSIGPDGAFEADPANPIGVSVIAALWPGQAFELSPELPLRRILDEHIPLMYGRNRLSPCEVRESVSGGTGGSYVCVESPNLVTGYAIAPALEQGLVFVWRCCDVCREMLRSNNRSARDFAEDSDRNARYVRRKQ